MSATRYHGDILNRVHLKDDQLIPEWPDFTPEEHEEARSSGDVMPLLFEWYKWSGLVANQVASIDPTSPAYRQLPVTHVAALRGLLNRMSRLMVAILRLASAKKHGEATRLLNRSVLETAVVLQWLCAEDTTDAFTRYFAKGLSAELHLKRDILNKVAARGGKALVIEERMLATIDHMLKLTAMTEEEVMRVKPLPDLASIYRRLGISESAYIVAQRLGSHAVHGTWPDLLFHYIEQEGDAFVLTDNVVPADASQLSIGALFVLSSVKAFVRYVLDDENGSELAEIAQDAIDEVRRIYAYSSADDFTVA